MDSLKVKTEVIAKYDSLITIEVQSDYYEALEWLSGSHVIQRVPPTEAKGRRHTSVVSVVVLRIEDTTFNIEDSELSIETMRGTGPGGQAVNKTESTVRVTHKSTGISARINGPDQHGNKKKALEIVKARVAALYSSISERVSQEQKKGQIGNERGNRDFTWSYIEGFVKNHKTGTTYRRIKDLEKGKLDLLK